MTLQAVPAKTNRGVDVSTQKRIALAVAARSALLGLTLLDADALIAVVLGHVVENYPIPYVQAI